MTTKRTRQLLTFVMALIMAFGCFVTPAVAAGFVRDGILVEPTTMTAVGDAAESEIAAAREDNTQVDIMVRLDDTTAYLTSGDLQAAAAQAPALLKAQAQAERKIEAALDAQIDVNENYALLFNGFSFTGESWMVAEINRIDGLWAYEAPVFTLVEPDDEVTPAMSTSTGMISASDAWELGYTGEGTVVAVIDTGIRGTHEAFSVMPENAKIDKEYLENVYAQYGDYIHAGSDVEALYNNEKLPFNWDYFDFDYDPNHTASDHGTHVAGIAAGNNGADFKGVAPDAQVVVMQVFTNSGGASFATILAALEDCVYLGVDSLNMSLGSPAGFTAYEASGLSDMEAAYEALQDAGISIAVAAGNDANTLYDTNYNLKTAATRGLSSNPDLGLVGSPATLPGSFSVASVVNAGIPGYAVVDGKEYYYEVVAGVPALSGAEGERGLVYVGYGYVDSYEGLDVTDKIVLVQRGDITFTEKCQNAADAGAAGVLMFNNVSGSFNPSIVSPIPYGKLTLEQGLEIVDSLEDGVNGTITIVSEFNGMSVSMASSSSWGTTADLRITPDIAAPGDGITSAIGFGGDADYQSWSGTSMATPHVAAGLNVIKQRVAELFPDATAREINDLGYSFAMSTAHQVNGFVRQQGAGIMDIAAALTTEVYLSVDDNVRPKLELDDSQDGTFEFTVYVNNVGDNAHTYDVDVTALTEEVTEMEYSGDGWLIIQEPTIVKLITGTIKDVTGLCVIDAPETVTVAPGETVAVDVSIACSEELMAWFQENCPSGMYLEGFVTLNETGTDGPIDLSIPYLGFVGDWDYASMLDRGYYWQTATGELNFQQMCTSTANFVGSNYDQGIGINPYADMTGKTYLTDRNAISPNGDGMYDALAYIEFTLLRNPKTVKLYVTDENGDLITTLYDSDYSMIKDYYVQGWNGGDTFKYFSFEYAAEQLAEGETGYLVLETWLDHAEYDPADNESGRWVIPFTKDLTAPAVKVVDGGLEIVDENYVAYYAVYADEAKTELLYEEGVFAEERGVASTYETDAETLYVLTADYAGNEQIYLVENGLVYETDIETFYHGRTVIAQQSVDYAAGTYDYEWFSFKADQPGSAVQLTDRQGSTVTEAFAEYGDDWNFITTAFAPDGTMYINTVTAIYKMDPETREVEQVWTSGEAYIFNIAYNPGTNDMYGLMGSLPGTDWWDDYLCKIDLENGTYTPVFKFPDANTWAVTFIEEGVLARYVMGTNGIDLLNMNGEMLEQHVPSNNGNASWGASHLGIQGSRASLLYDDQSNALYLYSDWSWFLHGHYGWAGSVKFDLDTDAITLMVNGNAPGRVFNAAYFEEATYPDVKVALTDFQLSEDTLTLESGSTAAVDIIKTPEDANWYDLTWTVEDPSVAAVTGNRKNGTVNAVNPGTTTVTVTATDRDTGEFIAEKTVEVNVILDYELQIALNVPGGELEFVSYAPYPFVPASDGSRVYAESSNMGASNSESRLVMTEELHIGDTIAFDYFVSSEADYDYLFFYANGELVFQAAGQVDWTRYEYVAPVNGAYTFEWVYVKDPATEEGTDNAGIDNVELIPGGFCAANTFTDVDVTRYYHAAVDYMVVNGYMNGMSGTTFGPDATLTRGQLVTILYRIAGEPSVVDMTNPFSDLNPEAFYFDAVVWAANTGIVNGMTTTTFQPDSPVTRQQIATILYRVEGQPEADTAVLDAYADGTSVNDFAKDAMAWAVSTGLINGMTETTLVPNGDATRGQAVTILVRYLVG